MPTKLRFSLAAVSILLTTVACATRGIPEAAAYVANYLRFSDGLATGGTLDLAAAGQLEQAGFRTVIDIRTIAEGVPEERVAVEALGLEYVNIPIGSQMPTAAEVDEFKRIFEAPGNQPVLFHCRSGNRVGQLWALYRIDSGADIEAAIGEGQRMGMRDSRTEQVRARHQQRSRR